MPSPLIILLLSLNLFAVVLLLLIFLKGRKEGGSGDLIKVFETERALLKSEFGHEVSKEISANNEKSMQKLAENNEKTLARLSEFEFRLSKLQDASKEDINETNRKYQERLLESQKLEFNGLKDAVNKDFEKLVAMVEAKLEQLSGKVNERLDKGFEKTVATFNSVIERLAKIDEAQKKIEDLSKNVVDLQFVLTDKKSRGIFGEVQLNQILYSIFGEKNDKLFKTQYSFKNSISQDVIADAVVYLPAPLKMVCVDSKFPLENFRRMSDKLLTDSERSDAAKEFKNNLKNHIDTIAKKYIVAGVTGELAILFLPAEAIFAEVTAYHPDLMDYARNKKVWITSPTTFIAFLTVLQAVVKDMEIGKQAEIIQQELKSLSTEFDRYSSRWQDLVKHIRNVSEDVEKLNTTSDKISKRFNQISLVDIQKIESLPIVEQQGLILP